MSELRTNRIIPRDGLVSGTGIGGGIIQIKQTIKKDQFTTCLLYTSPSPRDGLLSRMPSSA